MEAHRKNCFELLRHKNACSIDELKSRLRKLYVQDLKSKRDRVLKDKRDMIISEEDDLDFFTKYCRNFFGRNEDPGDVDEDLLLQIWEEIKLEEVEKTEASIIENLVNQSTSSFQIVCPVCLRSPASMVEGQVTCSCGLKFPLPGNISLKDFEALLLTCSELHSMSCDATPSYQVHTTHENRLQFVSSCESCQMLSIMLESQQQ